MTSLRTLAASVAAIAVTAAGLAALPPAAAAPAGVVINETKSQDGTPGDWIELTQQFHRRG